VRLNGTAVAEPDGRVVLTTAQVYGNCPQYIHPREAAGEGAAAIGAARPAASLDARLAAIIRAADTFFIATANPGAGADASHRGGRPGFVRVEDERHLLFPDYAGNRMFNSLGNIEAHPRAGLLFPDFASGDALLLSGAARILWDDPRTGEFEGAERLVEIAVERVIELPGATRIRFGPPRDPAGS
jgi:predicted pyridoxine 5'-phosphate oxidase superfamily flavin-nucleotide-binding protein